MTEAMIRRGVEEDRLVLVEFNPDFCALLRRRFPHLLQLTFEPRGQVVPVRSYTARLQHREPLDVCCDFVADVRHGVPADEAERDVLAAALEAGRRDRHRAEEYAAPRRRRRGVA